MQDFFISYTKVDKLWAEWIAWVLEDAGYTVFIQAWDILPGDNFVIEMQEAMTNTRKTIAVLSEDYFKSKFAPVEWADAFRRDREGGERVLIPIKVRECNPQGILGITVFIDIIGLSEQDARADILGAFSARRKPRTAPAFPGEEHSQRVVESPVAFPGDAAPSLGNITGRIINTAEDGDIMSAPLHQHLASAAKSTFTPEERLRLYKSLIELSPTSFNMLLFALAPPPNVVPSMPAPQKDRVDALLRWAGSHENNSLGEVQNTLKAMLEPPAQSNAPPDAHRGHAVINTCDRKKQEEEFETLFDLCNNGRCGHAQIYIIHGHERERHQSLVERFRNTQLRTLGSGMIPQLWDLGWPQIGNLHVDSQRIVSLLFEKRKYKDVSGTLLERARAFRESVASVQSPVIIMHKIDASEWLRTTRKLIKAYVEFWDAVKRADDEMKSAGDDGALPLFIVFLNVVYPTFEEDSRAPMRNLRALWHWGKIRRARVSLQMLSKMRGRSPLEAPAPQCASVALLEELRCVRVRDVKNWMIKHKYGNHEVESELHSKQLFVKNNWDVFECKNMADVELALANFVAKGMPEESAYI